MKIKVAQIGLGNAFYRNDNFKNYSHNYSLKALNKNYELLYAVDPIKKKRKKAETLFFCKTSNNLSILKNKIIDLLIISSPTKTHLNILIRTLNLLKKKPKVLLIEKPVALTIKQVLKIKEICRRKKIFIFVNYFREYEKRLCVLKKNFDSNSRVYVEYSGNYHNNASHFISLFIKLFGSTQKIEIVKKTKIKDHHILNFNLYFKNNNICYFTNKYFKKNHHFFSIENHKAKLKYDNLNQICRLKTNKNSKLTKIIFSQNFNNVYENIIKYLNKKKYCLSSIENAIEVHRILLECKKK